MDRSRRPIDVEEALSSMLWTPYERTPSISSSDEDEKLPIRNIQPLRYSYPTAPLQNVGRENKQNFNESMRYSFPYYGNFQRLPAVEGDRIRRGFTNLRKMDKNKSQKNPFNVPTISREDVGMVRSFTDDFTQYNVSIFYVDVFVRAF